MEAAIERMDIEEASRLGHLWFDRLTQSRFLPEDEGKFAAIDVHTGEYELDKRDINASTRLRQRCPNAEIWMTRVGFPTAYRLGYAR